MEKVENRNEKNVHTDRRTGLFASFNKTSVKTQKLVIAITVAVIASLAVVDVLLFEPQQGSTLGFQLMAALGTAIVVGAVTFALQQMGINQFNRSRDTLTTVLKAIARDSENVKAEIGGGKEWEEVAIALGQMQEAIAIRVGEAQQKAAAAEKAKEELQQQLIELIAQVEKDKSLAIQNEATASNEEEQWLEPPGSIAELVELLDDFRQQQITPERILGSSTIEEVKQHVELLEYRRSWLQALLDEASREAAILKTNLHLYSKPK